MGESQDVNDDHDPIEIAQGFLSKEYSNRNLPLETVYYMHSSSVRNRDLKRNSFLSIKFLEREKRQKILHSISTHFKTLIKLNKNYQKQENPSSHTPWCGNFRTFTRKGRP